MDFSPVVQDLVAEFPELETVAVNYHTSKSSEIYGDKTEIIWGEEAIQEGVLDYEFSLSPRAFYQLNPEQTEVLYGEAIKALDVTTEDHLIDAYCGVGTIGFAFAKRVKSLRGMDIIPEAIEDAKRNAKRMGFANTLYEAGTAEEVIPRWYAEGYRADALIVDPPRTGLMISCWRQLSAMHLRRWSTFPVMSQLWLGIWSSSAGFTMSTTSSRLICFRIPLGQRQW